MPVAHCQRNPMSRPVHAGQYWAWEMSSGGQAAHPMRETCYPSTFRAHAPRLCRPESMEALRQRSPASASSPMVWSTSTSQAGTAAPRMFKENVRAIRCA
jgi:hypothetical protein